MTAMIGGRYQIEAEIGAGGMGTVFRGIDQQTRQPVAIKQLKSDLNQPEVIERFKREGEALRQLNHPNIVKMLDAIEQDGQQYLIIEYIPGGDLNSLLKQNQLAVERVLQIGLDLADALTRAHRLNIIHRDLKPANVLIAEDGTPRLTDFGIAHMGQKEPVTDAGSILGTVNYLPPEVLTGDEVDARADIWAFGVMLFEMLAGEHPFQGNTMTAIVTHILTTQPPDLEVLCPECTVALADLVYRMLEKDRNVRIPSIRLVGAELEAILQGRETPASGSYMGVSRAASRSTFDTPSPDLFDANQPRHNLPLQTTPFVGREHELTELTRLLDAPATRLVTILAPGGMGKTRLALESAQIRVHSETIGVRRSTPLQSVPFSDGVYFVALAPLTSTDFIVATIADAVGFQFPEGGEPRQQLINHFREKKMLLVMDNFEHMLEGANIVSDILAIAPSVKILATSRERLNLSDEVIFALSGMDFPDWETPKDALNYAAVKLFIQSARRTRPDFELKNDDLTYLARICRLVAGMPLGIVLAAAWVESLSLKEIADEIARSLDFLETELRDVPERQRSVRGVFEYSWNRLSDDERTVFKKLSVFRGGFTREAAQAIAGASLKILTTLVNKSLLWRDPAGRYEVHELLRQYGEQEIHADGQLQAMRNAHAAYFADFLYQRVPDLKGRRQLEALDEIEADFENMRTLWQWATEQKMPDTLDRALEGLYWFFDMRGRLQEILELMQSAREALTPESGEQMHRAWRRLSAYLVRVSVILLTRSDLDLGTIIESTLALVRADGDRAELAFCLYVRGMFQLRATESQPVLPFFEESLRLYRELDDSYGLSDLLAWYGYLYLFTAQSQAALDYFQQSNELKRSIGDKSGLAWGLQALSSIYLLTGNLVEAERCAEEGLILMQEKRDTRGIVQLKGYQLGIAFESGDFEKSARLVQDTLKSSTYFDVSITRVTCSLISGILTCMRDKQYAKSIPLLEGVTNPLWGTLDPYGFVFEAHLGLALAYFGLEDYPNAHQHYQTALKQGRTFHYIFPLLLGVAALLSMQLGKTTRAAELLALIYTHPGIPEGWKQNWALLAELRTQLQAELGAEAFTAAWERGKARDLDATVQELVSEGKV